MDAREVLLALAVKHAFVWDDIYKDLLNKTTPIEELEQINIDPYIDFITIIDKEYPQELRQTYQPPFVIFKNYNELKGEAR